MTGQVKDPAKGTDATHRRSTREVTMAAVHHTQQQKRQIAELRAKRPPR